MGKSTETGFCSCHVACHCLLRYFYKKSAESFIVGEINLEGMPSQQTHSSSHLFLVFDIKPTTTFFSWYLFLPFLLIRDEQHDGNNIGMKALPEGLILSFSFPQLHLSFCLYVSFLSLLTSLLSLKFALLSLAKSSRIKVFDAL